MNEAYTPPPPGWNEDEMSRIAEEQKFLNHRIEQMSDYEHALFDGLSMICNLTQPHELINLTYNLECAYLQPHIHTLAELGEEYLASASVKVNPEYAGYISAEAAGRYVQSSSGGVFVDAGYVVEAAGTMMEEVYTIGNDLPIGLKLYPDYAHLLLASSKDYAERGDEAPTHRLKLPEPGYPEAPEQLVCRKLGVASLDECIILECRLYDPRLAITQGAKLSEAYGLASELYEMEVMGGDINRFFAIMEHEGYTCLTYEQARHVMGRMDELRLLHNVKSCEDYGHYCLKCALPPKEYEQMSRIMDMEAYGITQMLNNGAALTSKGVIQPRADVDQHQSQAGNGIGWMTR